MCDKPLSDSELEYPHTGDYPCVVYEESLWWEGMDAIPDDAVDSPSES